MKRIIVILLLISSKLNAQRNPLFSQYMFNGIAINPAYTGSEETFSIIGSYRNQWVGFEGAPRTQTLTAHTPLRKLNSALGIQFFADQIGVSRYTGIFGNYAYRIRFRNSKLALGVAGGMSFLKNNYSTLKVNDHQDSQLINDSPLGVLPDVSFGAHFYNEKYYFSFSVPMMFTHEFNGTKYILRNDVKNYNFIFGSGYKFILKNKMELKPSVLLKYRYEFKPQLDVNLMIHVNPVFEAGLSYRTGDAVVALFKINANRQFSVMYSLGISLTEMANYNYGSHEISLKYTFLYKTKISGPRFFG